MPVSSGCMAIFAPNVRRKICGAANMVEIAVGQHNQLKVPLADSQPLQLGLQIAAPGWRAGIDQENPISSFYQVAVHDAEMERHWHANGYDVNGHGSLSIGGNLIVNSLLDVRFPARGAC